MNGVYPNGLKRPSTHADTLSFALAGSSGTHGHSSSLHGSAPGLCVLPGPLLRRLRLVHWNDVRNNYQYRCLSPECASTHFSRPLQSGRHVRLFYKMTLSIMPVGDAAQYSLQQGEFRQRDTPGRFTVGRGRLGRINLERGPVVPCGCREKQRLVVHAQWFP
jgi:hypothetical protein